MVGDGGRWWEDDGADGGDEQSRAFRTMISRGSVTQITPHSSA